MLFPKNTKYKKLHKNKNNYVKKNYNNLLNFAFFAIKSLGFIRLSSKLLNIILFKTQGVSKKITKIWLLAFPNKSATKKKEKARMGKGVGSFYRWFCYIKVGQVIFEFESTTKLLALRVLIKVQQLIPIKLRLLNT